MREDKHHVGTLQSEPQELLAAAFAMDRPNEASSALGIELVTEVVCAFGSVRLRVTGTSMVPAVQPGDLLSVRRVDLREASAGDIVLVAREGRLFAHRVVAKGGSSRDPYLLTRGDRLRENDPPVSRSHLLGRVASIERGGRRVHPRTWLERPDGMLGRLLRASDRSTFLFVRLTALWRALSSEGVAWQARLLEGAAPTWSSRSAGCPSG